MNQIDVLYYFKSWLKMHTSAMNASPSSVQDFAADTEEDGHSCRPFGSRHGSSLYSGTITMLLTDYAQIGCLFVAGA